MSTEDLATFVPIPQVTSADQDFYLITDVSTGPEYLGATPEDVLPQILAAGRSRSPRRREWRW